MDFMTKWDRRFLGLALEIASWSNDPDKKVGAVIVDHRRRILGTGYNGLPSGVDAPELLKVDELKKHSVIHAELNAILNSTRDLSGATLYTTLTPCSRCSGPIIQSGIKRVVALEDSRQDYYFQTYRYDITFSNFYKAEVNFKMYEGLDDA